jgi:hypothetical protein
MKTKCWEQVLLECTYEGVVMGRCVDALEL